jgi:thiol-disulfide isomerase/thioredoxin
LTIMRNILSTALLVTLCMTVVGQSSSPKTLKLTDINGRVFSVADYKGKVLLINFWATWCIPCRTEIPDLIKLQRQYRNKGLRIVGVTYPPEKISEVRSFVRKLKVNYPVAIGTKETKSLFTPSETLPMTVVVDSSGEVRDVIEGIMYPEEFDQKVRPLLHSNEVSQAESRTTARRATTQKATILVGAEGYKPANVRLRRGFPARLTFVRKTDETCGTEIVIPNYGINWPLPLNTPVVITITPKRSGRFKFTCGMDMFRGSLLVR